MNLALALKFVTEYYVYFFCGILLALILFLILSIGTDAYGKDLKKILKATKILGQTKDAAFADSLPLEYRFMWQTYATGANILPRDIFRFVKKKQRKRGVISAVAAVVFAMALAVFNVALGSFDTFVIFGAAFSALFFGASLLWVNFIFSLREKKITLSVAKLVGYMDAVFGKNNGELTADGEIDEKATEELIEKIEFLREGGVPQFNAQKIASLLSAEKLSQKRTVEQQKKLNEALNGLVQIMSFTK